MLDELLEQLDEYNTQIRDKEKGIKTAVRLFYQQHREQLEELDREYRSYISSVVRPFTRTTTKEISFQQHPYDGKRRSLVTALDETLEAVGVKYNGDLENDAIRRILEADLDGFSFFSWFSIDDVPGLEIKRLQDEGYSLLFRVVGEILKGLNQNPDYNATYWGGRTDYVSRFFGHGKWKHLGLEAKRKNPYEVVHVKHDVNSPKKPFPDESEDVAILKTLGIIVGRDTYMRFWRKMTDALKIGGVVISNYEVPDNFRDNYRQITNLGNSGREFLEFLSVTDRTTNDNGIPKRIYFFEKVG